VVTDDALTSAAERDFKYGGAAAVERAAREATAGVAAESSANRNGY
jgi:hypothetical protein